MQSILYNHYSQVPKELWRWKNFTPKEIASKGDGSILINFDAMDKLQKARDIAGKPFHINSAYRDPEYNRKVEGAINSFHMQGRAFDISLKNFEKQELIDILKEAGFTGFGINYDTFVHADTGRERTW